MTAATTSRGLAGPRSLVAGGWRARLEVATVMAVTAPIWLTVLAAVWIAVTAGWAVGYTVAVGVVAWFSCRRVRPYTMLVWWRARWWWDARAGGLAVNAEPSLLGHDDGAVDRHHRVVTPRCQVIRAAGGGRCYRVRPLPGQTVTDFEAAIPRLVMRWAAAHVGVDYRVGERHVTILVIPALPTVRVWQGR